MPAVAPFETQLGRFIAMRPWIALASFIVGVAITVVAFWIHSLWLAILGAPFLGGGIGVLVIPLPDSR